MQSAITIKMEKPDLLVSLVSWEEKMSKSVFVTHIIPVIVLLLISLLSPFLTGGYTISRISSGGLIAFGLCIGLRGAFIKASALSLSPTMTRKEVYGALVALMGSLQVWAFYLTSRIDQVNSRIDQIFQILLNK